MPRPVVDANKCKLCGSCVDACPQEVLVKKDTKIAVAKPDDCIGCQACVGACSHEAIKVED